MKGARNLHDSCGGALMGLAEPGLAGTIKTHVHAVYDESACMHAL